MRITAETGTDQRAVRPSSGSTRNLLPPPSVREKLWSSRAERYELLAAARAALLWKGKVEGLQHPHDWHRTAKCKWVMISTTVGIHLSREHQKAFYSGLMNCGSVWACPVCAAKVQERRRTEIQQAIDWVYENGLQPVMVTLTFPHYRWNKLSDLVSQQADALKRLRAGAPWSRFKDRVGYQGLIRALELTYGANSWHPHTHEIWIVDSNAKADEMRVQILERWKSSCARAGLLDLSNAGQVAAFEAHAVDVKGWVTASDYLAKQDDSRHWGIDREMAKASTKSGKSKGIHPFGLLADAAEGDKKSGALFIEYADVMKGKRQLFWSKGLKSRVGIEDMTDEQLVEEDQDIADMLAQLEVEDWRLIREGNKRAQLLELVERGGRWPEIQALLQDISRSRRLSSAPSASTLPVVSELPQAMFSVSQSAGPDPCKPNETFQAEYQEHQLSLVPE